MPAFLAKLAGVIGDTPWFLLVIAGGVLALAGGIGQVPQYGLVISDEYVRWTFVVLGSVVFIAGALVGVAEYILPGYERTPRRNLNPKKYGMQILSPKDDTTVYPPKFDIAVTLRKPLAKGVELWVFRVEYPEGDPVYWPQAPAKLVDERAIRYEVTFNTGPVKERDHKAVRFFLVGIDGQTLIACSRRINRHFEPDANEKWAGFTRRSTDMIPAGWDKYHLYFEPRTHDT